jgi:hypothetical protein
MRMTRGQWRTWFVVAGGVGVVAGLVFGWSVVSGRWTWSRLEGEAEELEVPSGFTEIDRVRTGEGFCFVSCTGGGEAVLTVVMDPGELSVEESCRRVEQAVKQLAGSADAAPDSMTYGYRCDIGGPLDGSASVRGVVIQRGDIECEEPSLGCGPRWMEKLPVPDLPVIAWIEFNSGIE